MNRVRQSGPDVLRCLALLWMVITHAITYTQTLSHDLFSPLWNFTLVIRFAALTCVPLFLLLTGYLCRGKTWTPGYPKRLIPILLTYLGTSLLALMGCRVVGESVSASGAVLQILNFSANGYAWYVEMYLGLFLFIPFLNLVWEHLETWTNRRRFLAILIFFTLLPSTLQSFIVCGKYLKVIPAYWMAVYPLTYYYLGAAIATYKPAPARKKRLLLLLVSVAVPAALCYAESRRIGEYAWYMMNGFQTVSVAAGAVGFFLCLYDLPPLPRSWAAALGAVSDRSLEVYLLSYVSDQFLSHQFTLSTPAMVAGSLALAIPGAFVLRWIVDGLIRLPRRLGFAKR